MTVKLEQLEQQVFRSYWDDGLLDLFAGAGILGIGIFWVMDIVVGGAILPALMVPLWTPFRQKLIEPRLGLVEFSDRREQRNHRFLIGVFIAGVGTLMLGIMVYFFVRGSGVRPDVSLIAALPAVLLGILALFTGFLLGAYRFFVYAVWLAMAGVLGSFAGQGPGVSMIAGGAVITISATFLLARFIRMHSLGGKSS